ncbi:MAG TPA: NAD-dependent epimerase/dehydratase family protein, partial [Mycobacteriales bacterium]|nr:NAD-dependent epimerase/dehydratase family protein [Mycobacteriales bacterium]
MKPRVVLVTGVSRYLGTRLASTLAADPTIERVIGVDTVQPRPETLPQLGRTEFVRADIRNPLIAKVIAQAEVDTVVHMNVIATPLGAGGRTAMKEINVIGTMQLLAACQKAPSMQRLVVKSTTAVYGSSPRDPALFTEDAEPRALPKSGYAKDAVEVEGYVRGFGRRRPDVTLSVLRFTNFIGPTIDTPLTRYLSL